MQADINELQQKARQAKSASKKLSFTPTRVKNEALLAIAQALLDKEDMILHNNGKDYKEAEASGMSAAMLDRLMLDSGRLKGISDDVKTVAALPDPVGEIIEERTLPNGLHPDQKARAPGRDRRYLREPPQRDRGYIRALPQGRQRRGTARR